MLRSSLEEENVQSLDCKVLIKRRKNNKKPKKDHFYRNRHRQSAKVKNYLKLTNCNQRRNTKKCLQFIKRIVVELKSIRILSMI